MKYGGILILLFFTIFPVWAEDRVEDSAGVSPVSAKDMLPVQAMKSYEQTYDVLMENVVNIKTPGYKAFDNIVRVDESGAIVSERMTRFTKGTLVETNNKLDVALEGDGFFVAQ